MNDNVLTHAMGTFLILRFVLFSMTLVPETIKVKSKYVGLFSLVDNLVEVVPSLDSNK